VGAVLFCVIPAFAEVSDAELQREYGDKVLTLRQFIPGSHLRFDQHGGSSASERGPWTLYGQVRVQRISLEQGVLHIRGRRVFLFYDPQTKQLRDVASVAKHDPQRKLFRKKVDEWQAQAGQVEIEVECDNPHAEMAGVVDAMNAVFLRPEEALTDAVPEYWKPWFRVKAEPPLPPANADKQSGAVKVGGGVSAPRVTYDPDPEYSEMARQAKFQGTTILWLVVDEDGLPKHIRILKPLGLGLDEQAVEAVQRWQFAPSMKDGTPVPVKINVEVNFKLY
jgi:TonB family protein